MKNILKERTRMQFLAGILSENELNPKEQIQVWFDLDGVLADMDGSLKKNEELNSLREDLDNLIDSNFEDYKGLSNDDIKTKFKKELELDPNNESLKLLKKVFNKYNSKVFSIAAKDGFYANLDLMPGAIEMFDEATNVVKKKPNILTAPVGDENNPNNPSVKEKIDWVEKHFGDKVNHMEVTIDKGRVVKSKYDILIDDRTKYVDKFKSAGGSAILYKNANQAISELKKLYDDLISD